MFWKTYTSLEIHYKANQKYELMEGYAKSGLSTCAGFMTYRFVALYTDYRKWYKVGKYIDNVDDLRRFFEGHTNLDHIVHMENLDQDLSEILHDIGYDLPPNFHFLVGRVNPSKHLNYRSYYDDETEGLVTAQEKFIIDKYGYTRPSEEDQAHRRS